MVQRSAIWRRKSFGELRRPQNGARRGIALIDVIVGAVILGIGIAVVISLSSRSIATQADGEHRLVAAWLADELLNMVLVDGPREFPTLNDMRGQYDPPFERYSYELIIEEPVEGEAYRVTAMIGWEPVRGSGVLTVQTYIAPRLGDPDQPREPEEWIDRDQRHYERLYGKDAVTPPTTQGSSTPQTPQAPQAPPASRGRDRGGVMR